jgi:hypothetical protein
MKSKPVSQSSPETGDARPDEAAAEAEPAAEPKEPKHPKELKEPKEPKHPKELKEPKEAKDAAAHGGKRAAGASGKLSIELEVSRNRYAGWTVFGLVFGALLILKLGTVGQWVGGLLMVLGVLRAWQLVQTFLHPPGTIVVGDDEVVLPRGLCVPRPVKVPARDVTAVYFLRRSVPWNRSAPVLVIELGPRAMAFPRDWFASEADQRHIVHALLRVRDGAPAVKAESAR